MSLIGCCNYSAPPHKAQNRQIKRFDDDASACVYLWMSINSCLMCLISRTAREINKTKHKTSNVPSNNHYGQKIKDLMEGELKPRALLHTMKKTQTHPRALRVKPLKEIHLLTLLFFDGVNRLWYEPGRRPHHAAVALRATDHFYLLPLGDERRHWGVRVNMVCFHWLVKEPTKTHLGPLLSSRSRDGELWASRSFPDALVNAAAAAAGSEGQKLGYELLQDGEGSRRRQKWR